LPWSAAHVAYSLIRPKSQISNIRHDGTLSIGNFMLMMKKPKNLEFEPVHPKMCSLLPWYTEFPVYYFMQIQPNKRQSLCLVNIINLPQQQQQQRLTAIPTKEYVIRPYFSYKKIKNCKFMCL
jgi:hypothetical protein